MLVIEPQLVVACLIEIQDAIESMLLKHVCVQRTIFVQGARDGVDQNGSCLLKIQITVDSGLRNSVGSIEVYMEEARHFNLQLFTEQVIEISEYL